MGAAKAIRWLMLSVAVVAFVLVLLSFKKAHTGTERLKKLVAPAQVSPAQSGMSGWE